MAPGCSTSRVPSARRLMPWKRSSSTMAASRSSFTTSAPPSMVVMFLLGWKLNDTRSPVEPISFPWAREPIARAASSRIRTECRRRKDASTSGSMGALKCVGSSSRVLEVTAAPACAMSRLRLASSTSTNTVLAPLRSIRLPVTKKLCAGVITSSPAPTPSISSATCIAAVAEVNVRTGRAPKRFESVFSNAATRGPVTSQRLRSVSLTAAIIASSIVGREKGRKSARPGPGLSKGGAGRGAAADTSSPFFREVVKEGKPTSAPRGTRRSR